MHLLNQNKTNEAEQDTDAPLRSWELKEMGMQAVSKIRSSETPLLALQRLSQDVPGHAVALSRTLTYQLFFGNAS